MKEQELSAAVRAALSDVVLPPAPPLFSARRRTWLDGLEPRQLVLAWLDQGLVYTAACALRRQGVDLPELAAYEAARRNKLPNKPPMEAAACNIPDADIREGSAPYTGMDSDALFGGVEY